MSDMLARRKERLLDFKCLMSRLLLAVPLIPFWVVSALATCEIPAEYRADAFSQPMRFFTASTGGNLKDASWVVGVGTIEPDTHEKLNEVLAAVPTTRTRLVLNSPGGSLLGGLELGRLIRSAGLSTTVGRTILQDLEKDFPCRTMKAAIVQGRCESACSYAFLGGVQREVRHPFYPTERGLLGFHQFWKDSEFESGLSTQEAAALEKTTISVSQIITGLIAEYLSDIDVDAGVLNFAAVAGPGDMNYPTEDEMAELRVLTSPYFSRWFIEPYKTGLVAASRELSPLTYVQQITAYCRSSDSARILMLTSDLAPQRSAGFGVPPRISPPSNSSRYGAIIGIDDVRTKLPAASVEIASSGDLAFIRIVISSQMAQQLETAQKLNVALDAPRSEGYHGGAGYLTEQDRRGLRLAFKNCI